jgi:mannose-6-phosphate isomerase-like protein (cupin superfamily)
MQDRYPCPYLSNEPYFNSNYPQNLNNFFYAYPDEMDYLMYSQPMQDDSYMELMDYGPNPFVINIEEAAKQNDAFRTTIWTGEHLQVTLMSINVGEDIGFEVHPSVDQFIRIENGQGVVLMGDQEDQMDFQENVYKDFAFVIPAGKWHNLINTGDTPIKLYSIYAPPQHPHGTVHQTKEIANAGNEILTTN